MRLSEKTKPLPSKDENSNFIIIQCETNEKGIFFKYLHNISRKNGRGHPARSRFAYMYDVYFV